MFGPFLQTFDLIHSGMNEAFSMLVRLLWIRLIFVNINQSKSTEWKKSLLIKPVALRGTYSYQSLLSVM